MAASTIVQTIGPAAARRIALAAQGFADPRPTGPVTRRHLLRVLGRIRLLQLDSVNVLARAHYLPVFSRLGPYPKALLDDAAWAPTARRPRLLVEYWAHEASLVPVLDWPLLHSGAKKPGWWQGYGGLAARAPELVSAVLKAVQERGPVGAGTLARELGGGGVGPARGSWWNRTDIKRICEWLFGIGELTTGTRRGFERLYDLPERVLPPEVLGHRVGAEEGARELISRAGAALGVATETDLRDYYRLRSERSRQAVAELVEAGELEPVVVRGWRAPAYLHRAARRPLRVTGGALLCPFDPLIWDRKRTERLFRFRYRVEIYVPEHRRSHGYYVLPFLLDGELVARVDLKADRTAGVLRVLGAFAEPGTADDARVVIELARALREMAQWLELDGITVGQRGDLVAALGAATRPAGTVRKVLR
ncbi:MAG TPA: crosslink repair DNA glycosylase YcaQ family protein [Pseudonocardiaceae bacterium]|nr:crosslink repair DNA glycosylase YcaQ family protein [Pseudonocardiaceae bacterium]